MATAMVSAVAAAAMMKVVPKQAMRTKGQE
jgi:hypothetical protein